MPPIPTPVGLAGVFTGGFNAGSISLANTDLYFYATNAVIAGTNLKTGIGYLGGVGNYSMGVFAGNPHFSYIYTYATNAVASGASLLVPRQEAAGVGNTTVGIFGGMLQASGPVNAAITDIYTYAFGTMSAGTNLAPLATATYAQAAVGNSTMGVFNGGNHVNSNGSQTALALTNIYTYATNAVAPGTTLGTACAEHAGIGTSSFGIFGGGGNNFPVATTTVYTYSNNGIAPGNNLGTARSSLAATGNPTLGVFGGGAPAATPVTTTDVYTYSGNTVVTGTALKTAAYGLAATSGAPGSF